MALPGAPPVRVALNGFCRVGRNLFRLLSDLDDFELVAIADPAPGEALEYLLRYDSELGRFPDPLVLRDGHLTVGGQRIPFLAQGAPGEVEWRRYGAQVVVEATGKSRTRAELARHLEAGARRVVLCSPPADAADATIVAGVNDHVLRPEHRVVSNGSATAHCAAPLLAILERAFGLERVFLSVIHAYTNKQRLADVPADDLRSGRAAAENIIPQESNADEVIEEILPELRGRIVASALNVPVANGSLVDLVCWHSKPVTIEAINDVVRTAAGAERWRGIVSYEEAPLVSTDIQRSSFSGTFDAESTMVMGEHMSKTLTWFDNHGGYVNRAVDLIRRLARLDREAA